MFRLSILFLSLALFSFSASAAPDTTPPAAASSATAPSVATSPTVPAIAPAKTETAPAGATAAAPPTPPEAPDILFLQNLRKIGATIYSLGDAMGMHGWLAIKGKQTQVLYTTPDNSALVVGVLLSAEGTNISQQQVAQLSATHPDIAGLLKENESAKAAMPAGDVAEKDNLPKGPPSEKLYAALQKAPSVTVGADQAPSLLMVMDVNCPFCHHTWRALQPSVDADKLRVTMVPIQALGPRSGAMAAIWLAEKDPYDAWKKHLAGDEKALTTGTPDAKLADAVYSNTQLIRKWGVDQIPYLFYRGKSGKVRMIIGEPKDVKLILNDIAPPAPPEKK